MRTEELDTPALTVDLDIMERNLRSLSDYSRKHGLKLRPHTNPQDSAIENADRLGCSGITVAK
jgi:D-serine deaminase-like pyridoxal phosphate-dependent protein